MPAALRSLAGAGRHSAEPCDAVALRVVLARLSLGIGGLLALPPRYGDGLDLSDGTASLLVRVHILGSRDLGPVQDQQTGALAEPRERAVPPANMLPRRHLLLVEVRAVSALQIKEGYAA